MKKVIIDRSRWRTATHGVGDTKLRNRAGYMCCLGFYCDQIGKLRKLSKYAPEELRGLYKEETLLERIPELVTIRPVFEGMGMCATQLTYEAIDINDDEDISNKEREAQLIELFAKHGVKMEFTGEYQRPA